jgi:hypothetical protein
MVAAAVVSGPLSWLEWRFNNRENASSMLQLVTVEGILT